MSILMNAVISRPVEREVYVIVFVCEYVCVWREVECNIRNK